jgi:hypothetical protein
MILRAAARKFVLDGIARHVAVALHALEGFLERGAGRQSIAERMKSRLFDVARDLDAKSRIAGRCHRNSPQTRRLGQRTADRGTVEGFDVEAGLGQQ